MDAPYECDVSPEGLYCLPRQKQSSQTEAGLQIFFQDWRAEVTHRAKNVGSFSEMMGPRSLFCLF